MSIRKPRENSIPAKKTRREATVETASDTRPAPFDKEKLRIDEARERWIERTPPVEVDLGREGATSRVSAPHNDDSGHVMRMGDALGTRSPAWLSIALRDLEVAARSRRELGATTTEINAALAVVSAIGPQNELEAALAVQMTQNHFLSAELMGKAKFTDDLIALERYTNLSVKLQRTFTAQIEALARMRGKGQQTVRVEHVTVQAGAQAIVGDVHHHPGGPGSQAKTAEQPHETSGTAARTRARQALPSPDPTRNGVPITGDAERPVSHPRRAVTRRAGRKPERLQARSLEPRDDRNASGAADDAS